MPHYSLYHLDVHVLFAESGTERVPQYMTRKARQIPGLGELARTEPGPEQDHEYAVISSPDPVALDIVQEYPLVLNGYRVAPVRAVRMGFMGLLQQLKRKGYFRITKKEGPGVVQILQGRFL